MPPEHSKGADRFWYGAFFLVGFQAKCLTENEKEESIQ
jgi:hypothetical protein